jgi:hypothetical protein
MQVHNFLFVPLMYTVWWWLFCSRNMSLLFKNVIGPVKVCIDWLYFFLYHVCKDLFFLSQRVMWKKTAESLQEHAEDEKGGGNLPTFWSNLARILRYKYGTHKGRLKGTNCFHLQGRKKFSSTNRNSSYPWKASKCLAECTVSLSTLIPIIRL